MTDAPRASVAVWPRTLRRSPLEQAKATGKWRNNIRRGGSRARQSERTTGNEDLLGGLPAPRAARSSDPRTVSADVLLTMAGIAARGREQSRQELLGSWRIPGAVLSSLPRPRTTLAIGRESGKHSRTGFDSDSTFLENHSIRWQGIIVR